MSAAHPSRLQPTASSAAGPAPAARPATSRSHIRARRLAVISAAAAVVWAAAGPLAGIRLAARVGADAPAQQIGVASVITVSLLAGLAAWALLAVLEIRSRHPRRAWTIAAASVLVVSLTGPLSSGGGAATIAALACLHLAAGGVLILALRRTARP
jgi:hypothetical protein